MEGTSKEEIIEYLLSKEDVPPSRLTCLAVRLDLGAMVGCYRIPCHECTFNTEDPTFDAPSAILRMLETVQGDGSD